MDLNIQKAKRFIDENIDKKLTLKEVTRHCSLSISRFSELFKKETGTTFKKYLMSKRMEKAKELLRNASLYVKQVSYSVGYKSIPTFCSDFKKINGLSPSEYRKRMKKNSHRK